MEIYQSAVKMAGGLRSPVQDSCLTWKVSMLQWRVKPLQLLGVLSRPLRCYTQGCSRLLVVTDHEPFVKLIGDRTLYKITNTRLFRLKQRTLQWHFDVAYSPRKTNLAADATSRNPWSLTLACQLSVGYLAEQMTVTAINNEIV